MIDYDSATDDEINEAVLCHTVHHKYLPYYRNNATEKPDYCNSWADAGPIIVANRIATGWAGGDDWSAIMTNQGKPEPFRQLEVRDANPLRAAMVVFLKMMEAEV